MVAMTMHARGWDELGDDLKELEGRKQQLGAAVDARLGESVAQAALGRGEGGGRAECVQTFERERRESTVADESLDARPVLGLDAHEGVLPHAMHASRGGPASTLNPPEPCPTRLRRVPRHAGGIDFVEESVATEGTTCGCKWSRRTRFRTADST